MELQRKQLVPDTEGKGGYVTLYGKHGSRTIRVGWRNWEALLRLAEGKEPDDRIVAITDERIRQILTASAKADGLKKKLSPPLAAACPRVVRAPAAPAAHPRFARPCLAERDEPLPVLFADGWGRVCT